MVIKIDIAPTIEGCPVFKGELGRVSVIMGVNGSGKSKLLRRLVLNSGEFFGKEYTPVFVEGGRKLNLEVGVGINRSNMNLFSNPIKHVQEYQNEQRTELASRLSRTFVMLRALEDEINRQYGRKAYEWQLAGQKGDLSQRATLPLMQLAELFEAVFPHMVLETTADEQLYVHSRGSKPYPILEMSDGEKQVLILLADVMVLAKKRSIFCIDEPESNLHPTLAERLWTTIEEAYPDSVFIYATHSLNFALRPAIDSVFVLGHGKVETGDLMRGEALELRPFLGSLPAIVTATNCLFVEGTETSFDEPFYRWLLGSSELEVRPVEGGQNVIAATSRQGVWEQIASPIQFRGVIDRDFKSDSQISSSNVAVLDLHEAESYLCHPDIVIAIQAALKNKEKVVSRDEVIDQLVSKAESGFPYVVELVPKVGDVLVQAAAI